jgi:acyl-CoA hydrolase
METHRLVLPEDLNHFGALFGGRLLAWVDEACWIAASLDYPHCQFVTIGMDKVEFRHSVRQGTILNIRCEREKEGRTSVSYRVEVFDRRNPGAPSIFSTAITYVSVDDAGRKRTLR